VSYFEHHTGNSVQKLKACLVAMGYSQVHGIDYSKVFEPTVRLKTLRLIMSLLASQKWTGRQVNFTTVFLNRRLSEPVFMSQLLILSYLYFPYCCLYFSLMSHVVTFLVYHIWDTDCGIMSYSSFHNPPLTPLCVYVSQVCFSFHFSFFCFLCDSNQSFHDPPLTPLRVYVSQPTCYQQVMSSSTH
jgi:hypothetical protein